MRRALPFVLALVVLLPMPASASSGVVTCVISVTLGFTPGVKLTTTGSVTATLQGAGDPCAPVPSLDIPGGLVTTATLGGGGDATVVGCTAILATGDFTLTFDEFFNAGAGTFAFVGTPEAGTLTLLDINPPRAIGEAALVADPFSLGNAGAIAACAMSPSGMTEVHFVGALAFATA